MTLLIDVGNTRIKVGYASTHSSATLAIAHHQRAQILPWLQAHAFTPQQALGVCVSSAALAQEIEQLLRTIHCPTQWLDATLPCPLVQNNYESPQRLGADRWLALIGVLSQHKQQQNRPIIHASFGTATTIDTILPPRSAEQKAQFIGGLILPGPKLMHDSLALNTAQLGQGSGCTQDFPTSTRAAISSGISAAQAGAVLRQWHYTWQKHLGTPLLVCSGGGWELIQQEMQQAYSQFQQLHTPQLTIETVHWQPTPVLDGLNYIAQLKNQHKET